jgi:hypothetical protein
MADWEETPFQRFGVEIASPAVVCDDPGCRAGARQANLSIL